MSRLVFVNEGDYWSPMWLDSNGFLAYKPQFVYSDIFWLDNIGFISETYNGYTRELFVDSCTPTLRPNGAICFFEIGEVFGIHDYNLYPAVSLAVNFPPYFDVQAKWQHYQQTIVRPRVQLLQFELEKQKAAAEKQQLENQIAELKLKLEAVKDTESNHSISLEIKTPEPEIEEKLPEPLETPKPAPKTPQVKFDLEATYNLISSLLAAYPQSLVKIYEVFKSKDFEQATAQQLDELFQKLELTLEVCTDLLVKKQRQVSNIIKSALLLKLLSFDDESLAKIQNFQRFAGMVSQVTRDSSIIEKVTTKVNNWPIPKPKDQPKPKEQPKAKEKPREIIKPVDLLLDPEWVSKKLAELFAAFASGVVLSKADQELLPNFASEVNQNGQTFLMLAIQFNMRLKVILGLLKNSEASLLKCDNNNENVFHYWAKYYQTDSVRYFEELCCKYITALKAVGKSCLFRELGKQNTSAGDTFLHHIARFKSEAKALQAVSQIIALNDAKFFLGALLIKNHAKQTANFIIDKKPEDWSQMRRLLYSKIPDFIFELSEACQADPLPFFYSDSKFFVSEERDVVYDLIDRNTKQSYYKFVDIEIDRFELQYNIVVLFTAKESAVQERKKFCATNAKIIAYFEHGDLDVKPYKNSQSIFGHLTDYICRTNDEFLEARVMSSKYLGIMTTLPATETLFWKKMVKYFETAPEKRVESSIVAEYREFIKASEDHLGCALYDAATVTNLPMLKFLVEECGGIISDELVCVAFANCPDNDNSIVEYLLGHHVANERLAQQDNLAAGLFMQATLGLQSVNKVLYLIRRGFNTCAICDNGQNIAQLVLNDVAENKDTSMKLQIAVDLIEALFFKPDQARKLAMHKDERGMTALKFASICSVFVREPSPTVNYLFKLLFENGADYKDMSTHDGQNILFFTAIYKNDLKLFELVLTYIPDAELKALLTTTNEFGRNILEAAKNSKLHSVDPKILSKLEAMLTNKPHSLTMRGY